MSSAADLAEFADAFVDRHPGSAARVLEQLGRDAIRGALVGRPPRAAAALLQSMAGADAVDALAGIEPAGAVAIVDELDAADAARLLTRLSEAASGPLLERMTPRRGRELRELMSYPPDSAGFLMDTRHTVLGLEWAVHEALQEISAGATRLSEVPVVDQAGRFRGTVALSELIGADPEQRVEALLRRDTVTAMGMASQSEVVELLTEHRLRSLPVVDPNGVLLGIVRHDALVRAARLQAAGEMQQMVGVAAQERALSTPWRAIQNRLPWLQVNLLTAFLAAAVVGLFEDTIARITALAVLLPVAAGQSGNTGAQALAVTMRGLALREIRVAHAWRVVRKEGVAGLVNGLAVGVTSALGVLLWSNNLALAALMAVAMVGSMFVASMAGALVPIFLSALGRNPATASSIILTTVTDIVGFFVFLGLATVFADAILGM